MGDANVRVGRDKSRPTRTFASLTFLVHNDANVVLRLVWETVGPRIATT